MLDSMANHASQVRRYQEGSMALLRLSSSLTRVYRLRISLMFIVRIVRRISRRTKRKKEDLPDELMGDGEVHRLEAKEYMDAYVNPESFVEAQRKSKRKSRRNRHVFPSIRREMFSCS